MIAATVHLDLEALRGAFDLHHVDDLLHPEAYDRMRDLAAEQLAKESAAASKGVLQGGKVLLREEGGTGGGWLAGLVVGWWNS